MITVEFSARQQVRDLGCYVGILTSSGVRLAGLDLKDFTTLPSVPADTPQRIEFCLKSLPMMPGDYTLEVHLKDMATHTIDLFPVPIPFHVPESPVYGTRKLDVWFGVVPLDLESVTVEAFAATESLV